MRLGKSLRKTIVISLLLISVTTLFLMGTLTITQEYIEFSSNLQRLMDDYIETKKTEIRHEVERVIAYINHNRATTETALKESIQNRVYEAVAIAENIYNSNYGRKSDKEIQRMITDALRPLIFNNGRGYFFIYDLQGTNILLPFSPELEGENLWNLQDSRGTYTIQETAQLIKEEGEGFSRWFWYKPNENEAMSEKIGFSKHFAPYDWWIGTGEYIEDYEADIQENTLDWINKISYGEDEDGYIYVYNFDGTILAHFLQEMVGGNALKDTSDPYGIEIVGKIIESSREEDGGFLSYEGKVRPSTGLRAEKISYTQSVPDWQWAVGTGVYVDAINEVVKIERKNLLDSITTEIVYIILSFIISLIIISVLIKLISGSTSDHLDVFVNFFSLAATHSARIDETEIHFSEFRFLADSANKMMDDKNNAEKEVLKLQNFLSNIINSMPSILIGVNKEGFVTQWNREAARKTGLSAEEAAEKSLPVVIPRLDTVIDKLNKSITKRQVLTERREMRDDNGETVYEDITVYPLITNGIEGAVIRVDDVTEQVRLEEMMVQSEKMLSVGGLAAGIAHELNNPLAGMIQTSSVLKSRLTDINIPGNIKIADELGISMEQLAIYLEKRHILRMVDDISDSGKKAAGIIKNMLSFARKAENIFSMETPAELIDETLELARTEYDLKKQYYYKSIKIVKKYENNLPSIYCEKTKIQQVILNILRNGAQAMCAPNETHKNSPQFTIRIVEEKAVNMLIIEIEDNGPGMSKKVQKRIFDPFFTTKEIGVGTGLGLSVSYFIICENHKGKMEVRSKPGMGTTFIISLPLE